MSLILKQETSNTVTTPPAGRSAVFVDSTGQLGVKQSSGTTVVSGNITAVNLTGSSSNVLYGNGVFAPVSGSYGNSNVVSLLSSFGSNTIATTGNIAAGYLSSTGLIGATGNVSGGNLVTGGVVSATGNMTGGNLVTSGVVTATGNVTGGNLITAGNVFAPAIVQNASSYDTRISLNSAAGIVEINANGNGTQFGPSGAITLGGASQIQGGTFGGSGITLGTSQTDVFQNRGGAVTVQVGANGSIANTWTFAQNGSFTSPGNISATGNIIGSGALSVSGRVSFGLVSNVSIQGGNSGQFLQTDGVGNLTWASGGSSTATALNAPIGNVVITGGSSGYVLSTDGSGTLSWTAQSGGSANLLAVSTDIVPQFTSVYDIGYATKRWYDIFISHYVDINGAKLTGETSGTSTILITQSDFVAGSLLADQILISDNMITPDPSSAIQYLGTKGVVIVNGNMDIEGDWVQLPVVQTTSIPAGYGPATTYSNPPYNVFVSTFGPNAYITINAPSTDAFLGSLTTGDLVSEFFVNPVTYNTGYTITSIEYAGSSWYINFSNYSGTMGTCSYVSLKKYIPATAGSAPLTTGLTGMMRYNNDIQSFQGYNGSSWQLLSRVTTPPTVLATTGTVNINLSGSTLCTMGLLTGDIIFTGSNYAVGNGVTIRVQAGSNTQTLNFPTGWKFVGLKPTGIVAGKTALLKLISFGTTEADCVAEWAEQT